MEDAMFSNTNTFWKIILFTTTIMLPIYLMFFFYFSYTYNKSKEAEKMHNATIASEVAANFANFVDAQWDSQFVIGEMILEADPTNNQMKRYLDRALFERSKLIEYTWTNPKGSVISSTNSFLKDTNLSNYDYIQRIIQGEHKTISPVVKSKINNEPILPIANGIFKNGELHGIIISLVNINQINKSLNIRFPNKTIEITDNTGNVISISNGQIKHTQPNKTDTPAHQYNRHQSTIDNHSEFSGWKISVFDHTTTAWYKNQQLYFHLLIYLSLIIYSIIITLLIRKKYIYPMLNFKNAAKEISKGNLSIRVNEDGSNTFVETSRVFNNMVDKLQFQIKKTDNLLSVSELAASIAHEVRNPMTVVRGFIQLLEKDSSVKNKEYFKLIKDELDRANMIINNYLSLAQEKKSTPKKVDINSIILELKPMLEAICNIHSCELQCFLDNRIPFIEADRDEIKQVILNLCRNGIEATNNGGTIKLETKDIDNTVIFKVSDNGCGIPIENMEKLFEGFFTTKENGTGLGLAVCKSIINKNSGEISVTSELGKGSTFTVCFNTTFQK